MYGYILSSCFKFGTICLILCTRFSISGHSLWKRNSAPVDEKCNASDNSASQCYKEKHQHECITDLHGLVKKEQDKI